MTTHTAHARDDGKASRGRSRTVAVVGGGLGGVGAAVMLRRAGYEDVTVFERSEQLGGVWHWNTYPGAACDVPSHLYEFSFAPNPRWSHRYAPQAEIRAYVEDVAARYGVLDRIRTGTEVESARWDERECEWVLETSAGSHAADVLISACGAFRAPSVPPIPGLETFSGPAFHTGRWRHDVVLAGKRVAVVGAGCSAIQVVPAIQPIVEHLDVYQRTPGWTIPRGDFAYGERTLRLFERFPALQRLDRNATFAFMELVAAATTSRRWLLRPFRALARHQITSAIKDPELRQKLTPRDELGCKRVMITDDWYPTLTKANVELVTNPIVEVTPTAIRTEDGTQRPAEVLVLATGFKMHPYVPPVEIAGVGGRTLAEEWAEFPRAYLGLTVPGFPNMFHVFGPNTGVGGGSIIYMIEAGMGHVIAALEELERTGARRIEIKTEAAESFDRELRSALAGTVWHSGCESYYLDENGNNPNMWPWLSSTYRRRTARLHPGAYELGALEREHLGNTSVP
jgi:cation diffusion facilitator CzcD-associated flavoprotein CzcO